MIPTTTKRWSFVTAQTNFKLEDVAAGYRMTVWYSKVTCANSNSVDVSVELGLATATLPAVSDDSATGGVGVFLSSGGIAHGGGVVETMGGEPIAVGADGEDLRLTCSVATGGSLRVIVVFVIEPLT